MKRYIFAAIALFVMVQCAGLLNYVQSELAVLLVVIMFIISGVVFLDYADTFADTDED